MMDKPTLYMTLGPDETNQLRSVGVDKRDIIEVKLLDASGRVARKLQGRRVSRMQISLDIPMTEHWDEIYEELHRLAVLYELSIELVHINLVAQGLIRTKFVVDTSALNRRYIK